MNKGLVQLYYGDGKGKTTAAVGQAIRAAGCGMKVMFQQFLKTDDSSELSILKNVPGIKVGDAPAMLPFYYEMNARQKDSYNRYASSLLKAAFRSAGLFDVVVLDEILDCVTLNIIGEKELCAFIAARPEGTELVMTGHSLPDSLAELCDYISEVRAVKHPFEKGQAARKGIEF